MTALETKLTALLTHPRLVALKDTAHLNSRLFGCGFVSTCSRCLGSGRYSYNQTDGDTCYGCNGVGERAAKPTKALVAQVEAFVAEGKLDAYAEEQIRKTEAKRAAKKLTAKAEAAEAAMAWRADYERRRGPGLVGFSWLSYRIHDWARKVQYVIEKLSMDMTSRHAAIRDGATALLVAHGDELIACIALFDAVFVASADEIAKDAALIVEIGDDRQRENAARQAAHNRADELCREVLRSATPKVLELLENIDANWNWRKGYSPV